MTSAKMASAKMASPKMASPKMDEDKMLHEAKKRFKKSEFQFSQRERKIFKLSKEEVEHNKLMQKREALALELKEKVNLTVDSLMGMMNHFKKADSDGNKCITYEEFERSMGTILGDDMKLLDPDDKRAKNFFCSAFFNAFDKNGTGKVDFGEMCMGMSAYLNTSITERLKFVFRLYDKNGDGKISRGEIATMLKHQWNHVATHHDEHESADSEDGDEKFVRNPIVVKNILNYANFDDYLRASVKRFDSLDKDGDRKINIEEFVTGIQNDETLFELFATDAFLVPMDMDHHETVKATERRVKAIERRVKSVAEACVSRLALQNYILLYMRVEEVVVNKKGLCSIGAVSKTLDSIFGPGVLKNDFQKQMNEAVQAKAGIMDKLNRDLECFIDFDDVVDDVLPKQIQLAIKYCTETYKLDPRAISTPLFATRKSEQQVEPGTKRAAMADQHDDGVNAKEDDGGRQAEDADTTHERLLAKRDQIVNN